MKNAARQKKEAVVAEIKDRLDRSTAVVLADYRGLNVSEDSQLRSLLREAGVEYKVLKNTLLARAAGEMGVEGLETYLEGPTSIAFSPDPVSAAKILTAFAKTHKALEIKGGLLEGRVLDLSEVKALADLPSREVLLAQVLGGMLAPLNGLVTLLAGPIRGLMYGLEALRKQKEEAEGV